ncbi:MAG: hypothetical protein NTY99_03380 [DPANN group archaeon]|nr:hypothetical protein [DPANN group archaeon]
MAQKGLTTIIAIILVVAMTMAVAAGAFAFFNKFQQQTQGATESSQAAFLSKIGVCVKLVSFGFNPIDNTSDVVVKNCGFREISLVNDNINVMVKTSNESCAFKINSQNCVNCTQTLGIGAFATLKINASEIECGSTLADVLNNVVGQSVSVVLSDRTASFAASITFVPASIVNCKISLSQPADQVHSTNSTPIFCYNYTITNNGNAQDAFRINFLPGDANIMLVAVYNDTNCAIPLPIGIPFMINLQKGQSAGFSYKVQAIVPNYQLRTYAQANSLNCAPVTAEDKVCSCYNTSSDCAPHPKCL